MKMERVWGYFLCTLGGLVMAVSGPCTGLFIFNGFQGHDGMSLVVLGLVVGGIPFGLAFLMFKTGRNIIRENVGKNLGENLGKNSEKSPDTPKD